MVVCEVLPAPLDVPLTVIAVAAEDTAMLAVVVTVTVICWEFMPSSVTLVGLLGLLGLLKVQRAPAGKPAVQLPGEELVEFVKLMVCVEPLTGAMVKVAVADCPAGT